MTLQGKGFFTINLSGCEEGEPSSILETAQAAGLSQVFVKIADGVQVLGMDASGSDLTAPVVQVLHAAGIAVWGWQYIYGKDPSAEAATAITRCRPSVWMVTWFTLERNTKSPACPMPPASS